MNKFEADALGEGKANESLDSMLRRFKKKVMEEGILDEVRRRQYFMNKATKRKEKAKRARLLAIKAERAARKYRDAD